MKNIMIVSMTALFSLSAFSKSDSSPSLKVEKSILCTSVEKQLIEQSSDFVVDMAKCLKTKMSSRLVTEGIIEIKGKVPFNSPSRKFTSNCSVSYYALTHELVAEASCN